MILIEKDVKKYDDNLINNNNFVNRHLKLSNSNLYYYYNKKDNEPIIKIPIEMIESIEKFPVVNSLK